MKVKRLRPEVFKSIYGQVPRLCVDLVIKSDQGIVLSKRDIEPSRGMWHLPGGTVLLGESVAEAFRRVAKEETGLTLKIINLIGIIEYLKDSPHFHAISLAYLSEPASGILHGSTQGKEVKYWPQVPQNTIVEQEKFIRKYKLL